MSERTSPPAKDPVLEAGDLQGRSQVPRGLGGPPLIWDFHVNCKRLRRCMKQSPLPRGLETGSHRGSVRGEVRATGPLADVTMATPESAPKPEATCLDATRGPLPRAWGCVQLASWPEGSRLTSPPGRTQSPGPSITVRIRGQLSPQAGLAAAASAAHRDRTERVCWGPALAGALGRPTVPCQTHAGLLRGAGQPDQGPPLCSPSWTECRCVGIQGQALPGSRASDVAFMSVSSWQPLS